MVLGAQPRDPVVLLPSTAQPGVFRSLTPSLTFDSTNWSVPQVFVLTGEDDDLIDGAQQATLIVSVDAATSDDDFDTVAPASVLVTTSGRRCGSDRDSGVGGRDRRLGRRNWR